MSRWVAGGNSSGRLLFVCYLSDLNLEPGGRAHHEIYCLTRYPSRFENPLEEYSYKVRVTGRIATLDPQRAKRRFNEIVQMETTGLIVESQEAAEAIHLFYNTPGSREPVSRDSSGLGARFDEAYFCAVSAVEVPDHVETQQRRIEVETTVYCRDTPAVIIHSLFLAGKPKLPGS